MPDERQESPKKCRLLRSGKKSMKPAVEYEEKVQAAMKVSTGANKEYA
jgi:hypothetical protein